MSLDDLYKSLERYISRLYKEFIKEYIKTPSLMPSNRETDNVKAFCVLSHAAFEEYFEKIAKYRISDIENLYSNNSFISNSEAVDIVKCNNKIRNIINSFVLVVSYAVYSKGTSDTLTKHKSKIDEFGKFTNPRSQSSLTSTDLTNFLRSPESYAKDIIKESKKYMNDVIGDSHGASLKYLLKILVPTGVTISNDVNFHNSLLQLSKFRGEYAHSFESSLTSVISPPDIKNYVIDCLKLCKELRNAAKL